MRILIILLFLFASFLTKGQPDSPWHIVAEEIDPSNYHGVTMANGMIGLVSSPEPLKVKDVVLNGVFDYYLRGRVSNILKSFNFLNMNLDIDGHRISRSHISNYEQVVDMKKAVLTTRFDVGEKASVRSDMMALRNLPFTALIEVEVVAKEDIEITAMSVIEAPEILQEVRNYYAEIDRPHVLIPLLTSVAKSPTGKHVVAASTSFIFSEEHGEEPRLIHEDWDYNMHLAKFRKRIKAGETYRFAIVGSTCSSEHYADAHNEAERLTIFARLEGSEKLKQDHYKAWEDLWQSDIEIQGNLRMQKAVRFAVYHLYAFAREGTAYSLSPMGLSGLGYNGHVFWDTELWMYPPLLLLQPAIAKSLLEYRYERLEAAKQNAFSHGFQGAMYPWESDDRGQEATPVWALTGPFQHHISGCVGWAFWKYYQVTGDQEWLRERGYPVLKEVADFWVSRVERVGKGQYNINNVIGANEWEENIDNNAFTNGIAKIVLKYATQASEVLGLEPNPDWLHVSENIPILTFPDGVTQENRTYDGVDIKQADVNLLAYPIGLFTEREQIEKDLNYYEPRMSPQGPAMGFSVLSTLHSRLGNIEKAYNIFNKSYQPNEVPPFGVIAETAGGTNPYFATGAGGMLQAVLAGFGGLEITSQGVIQLQSALPQAIQSIRFKGIGKDEETFEVN